LYRTAMSPASPSIESYALLGSSDNDDEEKLAAPTHTINQSRRHPRTLVYALATSAFLNLVLLGLLLLKEHGLDPWTRTPLYSPAQNAVQYTNRVFTNVREKTIYHSPPTDEGDQAWEDLYGFGISKIPSDQAILLPNETLATPGDDRYSVMSLDVFHQLHCLNMIRKALHPERYGPIPLGTMDDRYPPFDHVDHCVNSIRESLMCAADISANTFVYDEYLGTDVPRLDVWHTCRDFGKIQVWARERNYFSMNSTAA